MNRAGEVLKDVSGLVHDLKSPIELIDLNLDRLAERYRVSKQDVCYAHLKALVSSAQEITRTALLLNQLVEGNYQPENKLVDLKQFLKGVTQRYSPLATKFGVRLKLRLAGQWQPLKFDQFALSRILDNLISNALRFAPEGSTVTLGAEKAGRKLKIYVKDCGPGIPKKFQKSILRGKKCQSDLIGTEHQGLGMQVVRSLVKASSGKLALKSRLGQGAEFSVCWSLGCQV